MIPNSWLYKLRHMSLNSSSSSSISQEHFHRRKSHYFTRKLHISPSNALQPQHRPPRSHFLPSNDTVLDVSCSDNTTPHLLLPPIKTKPPKNVNKQQQPPRRSTAAKNAATTSPNAIFTNRRKRNVTKRVRLHNTPKSGSRGGRKSVRSSVFSDSFAVVKTSVDPYGDFKTSMMEMIGEKRIRDKEDLEELLACYLSLNSNEYHHLILTVFNHICFDFISLYTSPH